MSYIFNASLFFVKPTLILFSIGKCCVGEYFCPGSIYSVAYPGSRNGLNEWVSVFGCINQFNTKYYAFV